MALPAADSRPGSPRVGPERARSALEPREGAHAVRGEDLARCAELYEEALSSLLGGRGGALLLAGGASSRSRPGAFATLAAEPDVHVLAGWYEGHLAGIGVVRRAADATASPAQVEVLFVEPGMRGVGVGEALLVGVVEWCATQGCPGLDVTALPGDRATKSLLERCGFRARAVVMHRSLPG